MISCGLLDWKWWGILYPKKERKEQEFMSASRSCVRLNFYKANFADVHGVYQQTFSNWGTSESSNSEAFVSCIQLAAPNLINNNKQDSPINGVVSIKTVLYEILANLCLSSG